MNMHTKLQAVANSISDLETWPLRDVVNDTRHRAFCGPTAVASITRQPISVVKDAFRLVRYGSGWTFRSHTPAIMGVTMWELTNVMRLFGFNGEWRSLSRCPTVARWLETRSGLERTNPVILHVTGHFVTVRGWEFCDTFSKGQVVDAVEAPGRRKKVKDLFVVTGRLPTSTPIRSRSSSMNRIASCSERAGQARRSTV